MKILIFLAVMLSGVPEASTVQNTKESFFYYGNGVSFVLPNNWHENSDVNEITRKTLKYYIDEFSAPVIARLENNQGRLFDFKSDDHVGIIIFEEWAGSVDYSESLAETFSTITKKFLVDASYDDINASNLLSDVRMVDGVRSAHLELMCIKNGIKFFYKSTLIPIGSRFLHVYSLSKDEVKDLNRANYETFLKSFMGAGINNRSSENLGVLFQVFVICSVLFIFRLLKFSSSKKD
tara:strand:+ start:201 stop:908 length:708 start_codon:yes stop_codon:yes gene_type:complete